MNEDDLARMRAESDQAREGLKEVASNLWAFYAELRQEGFTRTQAMSLTQNMLFLWSRGNPGSGDSE